MMSLRLFSYQLHEEYMLRNHLHIANTSSHSYIKAPSTATEQEITQDGTCK